MVDIKIQLPDSFFEEEERWGFKITRERKELWAIELDLLCEFDRVCKKLELRYFLDSGTLLGAIRDGHFIPWDDDIDITMLREDYDKLLQYGPAEFAMPIFLQNAYTDVDYRRGITQLRRSDTTFILNRELDKRLPFNQGICIDILPLDGIAPQEELQQHFEEKQALRKQISNVVREPEHDPLAVRELFRDFEQISSRYRDAEYVDAIAHRRDVAGLYWLRREWFDHSLDIQFEGITFPMPVGYREVLEEYYGPQYMTPCNVPTSHGDVIWDINRSYKTVLLGEN